MIMDNVDCLSHVKPKGQHPNIAYGIIKSLQKVWKDHEHEDFIVSIKGEIFSCHKFILVSCSEFFRSLLRSNIKEKEMKVELNNISPLTFQSILDTLYSGQDLLTKENVLRVWSAVHLLQIPFLKEHCEDFVIEDISLDNVLMYKDQAECLQSEKVKLHIFTFMLTNFENLGEEDLIRLDFDYLIRLLKSDELIVQSEDSVLGSIVKWVKYGNVRRKPSNSYEANTTNDVVLKNTLPAVGLTKTKIEQSKESAFVKSIVHQIDSQFGTNESNDRKTLMIDLIKACRCYLASDACIVKLSKLKLIKRDILVKEILCEALNFKLFDYFHNYCPTPAIHRNCSNMLHVGIYCDSREVKSISLKTNTYFLPIEKLPRDATITIFKSQLYVCLLGKSTSKVYVLQSGIWVKVAELAHAIQLFLAHENYIYAIGTIGNKITRFNPETLPINLTTVNHDIKYLTYALGYNDRLVAFSSVGGKETLFYTAVHSWDSEIRVKKKHDILKISAQNLQSFRDDTNTYILDVNGHLLKLENSETFGFSFVAKLWTENYHIKGSLLFRGTLHLMIQCQDEIGVKEALEGVYSSRIIWKVGKRASNLLHYIKPKWSITTS